jgi:ribosomal protein S12
MKTLQDEERRHFKLDKNEVQYRKNMYTPIKKAANPLLTKDSCSKKQGCTVAVHYISMDPRNYNSSLRRCCLDTENIKYIIRIHG